MARLAVLAAAALVAGLAVTGATSGSTQEGPALKVSKSAPEVIDARDTFEYTVKVSNTGDSRLSVLTLTDQLPTQVTYKSLTSSRPDWVCQQKGGAIACVATRDGLEVKGSATVDIVVQDNVDGLASITNTATANAPRQKLTAKDSATTVVAATDLTVTKTGPATATVDDVVAYSIVVANKGQYTARDAKLTDTLPSQLQNVSVPAGCTLDAGAINCDLGDVAAGDSRTIQIAGQAAVDGTAVNRANVATRTTDTDHSNDVSEWTTVIAKKPPPPPKPSDLAIGMTVNPKSALVGDQVKYRIVVANKGPGPAPATVSDKLPASVTFVSVTKPCTHKAGFVTCKLGTLAVGKQAKPITLVTRAVGVGKVVNTATVTGGKDPVKTNDIAHVTAKFGRKPTRTATTPTVTVPTVTTPTVTTPTATTTPATTKKATTTKTTTKKTTTKKTTTKKTTTTKNPELVPRITLSPAVGAPGSVAHVTGADFPANATIELRWSKGLGTSEAVTNAKGNFTSSLLVFDADVLGPRLVIASPGPGTPRFDPVGARFLVALRALQPPDFEVH